MKIETARSFPKYLYQFLSVDVDLFYLFLSFSILTNSKKLLRNFEYSKLWDTKNYQYCSYGSRGRVRRSWSLLSFFFKDKDSTHTFNNKGQTAWNVNLIIYLMDTCMAIAYWTMLPPLPPDKGQSSLIFGSEKINEVDQNIDKEPQ